LLDATRLIGGTEMRLFRHRRRGPRKLKTIAITQAEITADLVYPAKPR